MTDGRLFWFTPLLIVAVWISFPLGPGVVPECEAKHGQDKLLFALLFRGARVFSGSLLMFQVFHSVRVPVPSTWRQVLISLLSVLVSAVCDFFVIDLLRSTSEVLQRCVFSVNLILLALLPIWVVHRLVKQSPRLDTVGFDLLEANVKSALLRAPRSNELLNNATLRFRTACWFILGQWGTHLHA